MMMMSWKATSWIIRGYVAPSLKKKKKKKIGGDGNGYPGPRSDSSFININVLTMFIMIPQNEYLYI